jgi:hypothetical protein
MANIVIANDADAEPAALLALTVTVDVPLAVGVPLINPVEEVNVRPAGKVPANAYPVGRLLAVIW